MKSIIKFLFVIVLSGIIAGCQSAKKTCVPYEYTKGLLGYSYSIVSSPMKFSEDSSCVYVDSSIVEQLSDGFVRIETDSVNETDETAIVPVIYVENGNTFGSEELGTVEIQIIEDFERFESNLTPVENFPLFILNGEDEVIKLKTSIPVDLSDSRGIYVEFEDLSKMENLELYAKSNNEWIVYYNYDNPYYGEFQLPYRDGEYLVLMSVNGLNIGGHFTIGENEYQESIRLDILAKNDNLLYEVVKLSTDNYQYEYYVFGLRDILNESWVITEMNNHHHYYNDFIYEVYDWNNDKLIDSFEFKNGNEIHYHDTVYYLNDAYTDTDPRVDILNAEPIHLNDIINNEAVTDIRVILYTNGGYPLENGESDMAYESLSNEQVDLLIEYMDSVNYYDVGPLVIGAGSATVSLEITTEQHVYIFSDNSGSLNVYKDGESYKWYAVSEYINNILTELKLIKD